MRHHHWLTHISKKVRCNLDPLYLRRAHCQVYQSLSFLCLLWNRNLSPTSVIPRGRNSLLMSLLYPRSAERKPRKMLPVSDSMLIVLLTNRLTQIRLGPSTLETIGVPSTSKAPTPPPPSMADTQSAYAQQLADVPEFAEYGPVLNSSSKPAPLTESETEYQVSVVKHIFKEHIVFQVRDI